MERSSSSHDLRDLCTGPHSDRRIRVGESRDSAEGGRRALEIGEVGMRGWGLQWSPEGGGSRSSADLGKGEEGKVRIVDRGRGGEGIQGARLGGEGRRGEGVSVWLGISSHYIR
jgi:hypothetical protein